MDSKMVNYGDEYSEESFWNKLKKYAKTAGKELIEKALVLYYCLVDPDTPAGAKAVIVGALGYFILPTDAIPDFTPAVGYSDDIGALFIASAIVAAYIKQEHVEKAKEKLKQWFE